MDKNKIIEGAAKLVAKGAYDKAIKEYQKVLEADPKDVRILQKMGELYQKKNDNQQAAFYFTKVAESYSADGFFLKAVALYKQVLKLDPTLVDVNLKLAELHQQLQLMSEAMAYYQIVANHYDKQGETKKSLEVLRKMVELDPENVASRIKLAELYAREQMTDSAIAEFRNAADHLKRNNRTDDYLRVAERISTLEPNNLQLARELAEIYLGKNDQKRALAKLQICFKADSRDIDTLSLLATAFQGLGQASKTISVYKELAKVYAEKGRQDEALGIWRKVAELDPSDAEAQGKLPRAAPARAAPAPAPERAAPERAAPARAAPASRAPAAPAADSLGKLLTETDVYVKYGLHDKALEHLRKVFSVDPENIDAHEKAYHIYVAAQNHGQAAEQLLNVLRLHTRRGDATRAQPYLQTILQQNPAHPEVPAFLAALRAGPTGEEELDSDVAEDAILVDSAEEEIIVAEAPEDALVSSEAEEVELASAESMMAAASDQADEYMGDGPPVPDQDEALVPEYQPEMRSEEIEVKTGESEVPAAEDYVGDNDYADDDEPVTQMTPVHHDAHTMPVKAYRPPPNAYRPEREVEPEPPPVAEEPVEEIQAEPEYAQPEEPTPYAPIEASPTDPGGGALQEEAVEAPPEDDPASEECDEATFFVEQGLFEDAREILETVQIAYPGHKRAADLIARIEAAESTSQAGPPPVEEAPAEEASAQHAEGNGVTNGAAEGKDAFDLATELANELGELEDATGSVQEVPSEDFQYSVDEVFGDFKKALEKVVKPEDVETHYDLGIAYKEMGLIEDAIGEFVVARQGAMGQRKEVDCLSMIGALQMGKGDFAAAVEAYRSALGSEHAGGDVEKAVRYELGGAYEQSGSLGKALAQYLKVQSLDGRYRDVDAMVSRLSAIAAPEDDEPPKGPPPKKPGGAARKVGYL